MLKTTFCPNCGKPYDVSLGECPVCARQRAEKGTVGDKSHKHITLKKKTIKDKVREMIPVSEPEEPTVLMNAEEIAAAQAEAKRMAEASRTKEKVLEEVEPAAGLEPEPEKDVPEAPEVAESRLEKEAEPGAEFQEEPASHGKRKLLAGIVVLAVALILLGAGIISTVSNVDAGGGADTPLGAVEQEGDEADTAEDGNQKDPGQEQDNQEQTGNQGQEEGGTAEPEKQPDNQNQAGAVPTTPDTTEPSEPVSPDTDETGGADTGDTGNQETTETPETPETPDTPDIQPEEPAPDTEEPDDNTEEPEPDTPDNEGENMAANAEGAEGLVNA